MKTKLSGAITKLEKYVQKSCNSHAADYDNGVKGFLDDLFYGGCQSGMVGDLIYYKDTLAFYKHHKAEITAMLKDLLQECGFKSPADLFGDKWDTDDLFADECSNQNLLAWFGYEETARKLADRNGIGI